MSLRTMGLGLCALLLAACSTGTPQVGMVSEEASPLQPGITAPAGEFQLARQELTQAVLTQGQLPGGGTEVFPRYRLYGWVGNPASPAFGVLGIGDVDAQTAKMVADAQAYATPDREVLPVMELITVVVQASPGPDGDHAATMPDALIEEWLAIARKHGAVLLLDVQPGSAEWLPLVQSLEKWLVEPDVGLALDPEWAVNPGETPGRVFGSMTGGEVDTVSAYLAGLVQTHKLPQKILVVHELAPKIVVEETSIQARPEVALVASIDGIGSPEAKTDTYRRVLQDTPAHVTPGFKLFLEEDLERSGTVMTPGDVLGLTPVPQYVMVE